MSLPLAEEIIKGRRLKRGEDLSFLLTEELPELLEGANKIRKELCEETPLGRLGTPEEAAQAIFFLASSAADFITGQILSPNGGIVI